MKRFLGAFAGVAVVLSAVMTGCTCPQVQKPASDATPPVINWEVTNSNTNVVQNFTGNAAFTARLGERYSVKMLGDDSAGVHEVSLSTLVGYTCNAGGTATTVGPGLASPDVRTENASSSGMVCTELYRLSDLDFRFHCAGVFVGGKADLLAKAENFYNGTTAATLTITITP